MAELQKTGVTTIDAVKTLAKLLGVDRRVIGYAGMKDARAVTRQIVTIAGVTPEQVREVKTDNSRSCGPSGTGTKSVSAISRAKPVRHPRARGRPDARDLPPPAAATRSSVAACRITSARKRFGVREPTTTPSGLPTCVGDDAEVLRLLLGDPRRTPTRRNPSSPHRVRVRRL
jgi:tRNA pseudouridine13 synthase